MQGIFDKARVFAVIEEVLTPYVGKTMAQASAQVHSEKLGIVAMKMTAEEKDRLLERLSKAMTVFVGKGRTETLMQEIDRKIRDGGKI